MAWSRAVGGDGRWGQAQEPGFPLGRVSHRGFQGELGGAWCPHSPAELRSLTHRPVGDARSQVTRAQDVWHS